MAPMGWSRRTSGRHARIVGALAALSCAGGLAACSGTDTDPGMPSLTAPQSGSTAGAAPSSTSPGAAPSGTSPHAPPAGTTTGTGDSAPATDSGSDTRGTGRGSDDACASATDLIESAVWIVVDGQDSLEIVPAEALRECRTAAGTDAGWAQVLSLAPGADAPGMEAQYLCHVRFASFKDVWHIEPWRPVVDGPAMALAACNPGGPDPDLIP